MNKFALKYFLTLPIYISLTICQIAMHKILLFLGAKLIIFNLIFFNTKLEI